VCVLRACLDAQIIDVECVEEASFLGVFVILFVMVLIPCVIATVKYFQQFSEYKKKKARGYTWDGKGNEIKPVGERDIADGDIESTTSVDGGEMEESVSTKAFRQLLVMTDCLWLHSQSASC